jgi:hypothetical protein
MEVAKEEVRAPHKDLPPSFGWVGPIISILGALLTTGVHDPEKKDITRN